MSGTKGAASAAPTLTELADQIRTDLAGIEGDNRAALAKAISAGEKLTQAKAQMGHGEWLPWLEKNFKLTRMTANNYMRLAANVNRVLHLESIREGLAALPKKKRKTSTRSQTSNDKAEAWDNDDVLAWVARRFKAGKSRNEVHQESVAGDHDWPLPGESLSQNGVDIARHILRDRKRRGDSNRARQPKESGKRLRQLHAQKRAGRTTELWYMQKAIMEMVGVLEGFELPDLDWNEETEDLVNEIYDDLHRNGRWNDAALDAVAAHMDELGRQRKIRMLRDRMNDPSSTPSERMTAARLAEKLERKRAFAN